MRRALVLAAVFVGSVSAAFAAEVKPPADPASVPVDPKQVVCRHVDASDQNMLPGAKVCHTRAEWAELDKQGTAPAPAPNGDGH